MACPDCTAFHLRKLVSLLVPSSCDLLRLGRFVVSGRTGPGAANLTRMRIQDSPAGGGAKRMLHATSAVETRRFDISTALGSEFPAPDVEGHSAVNTADHCPANYQLQRRLPIQQRGPADGQLQARPNLQVIPGNEGYFLATQSQRGSDSFDLPRPAADSPEVRLQFNRKFARRRQPFGRRSAVCNLAAPCLPIRHRPARQWLNIVP